jgi:hypothetical protein
VTARPGLVLAAVFLCIYGTLALTVNLPKATYGFKSDEATYYMMGLSLARDGDLTYQRKDLVRVWEEFPSGPQGVFLKRGQKIGGAPDPDPSRYYYGKSFIYPLFAAPLIVVFGSNGFLVLNALCLAAVLLCAYLFLHARSGPWVSALLAAAFVMMSVVPVYAVQIMPEVFNFSLACVAYFCWLYKEVASPERSPRGTLWLFTPRSDLAAAVLLAIATFSKPTNALLFAAPFLWWAWRILRNKGVFAGSGIFRLKPEATCRPLPTTSLVRTLVVPTAVFLVVGGGLFGINLLITGDWNYQGGGERRRSYYFEFPFQTQATTNQLGVEKSREDAMAHVIFNRRTFVSNLLHNLKYFFIGRYAGLAGYFFPGVFAMLALLTAPRARPGWQWLVLAAALAQGLIFIVATPYTWSGGGVGNRYFMSGYGVMVFLLPPLQSLTTAFVPWLIGGAFVAPLVLNPFGISFRPSDIGKSGPLRLFPVEHTLINDIPINTDPERAHLWFGDTAGDPGFLVYFLDDNAYGRELDRSFWTRGDSRAEIVFKTDKPMRRAIFHLAAGPVPVDVHLQIGGRTQDLHLDAGQVQQVTMAMPAGRPFEKETTALVWNVAIETRGGFTPIFFDPSAADARYLGVRVKPMLEVRPQ